MKEETKVGVLGQLRDHVRGERADDAALLAVASSDATSAAALALAHRAEGGDDEARALLEASRPLAADALDRITAKVSLARRATGPRSGRVLAFVRRAAVVAAPLAVAAALVLYLGGRGREAGSGMGLPDFAITASGEKEMRGADAPDTDALHLRGAPDASFEILARPATSTAGAHVIAHVFAIGEGEPSAVDANIEIAPEGAVRIRGRAQALLGAREVRVVLSEADGSIKGQADALARARDGKSDARVRVLRVKIVRD